MNLDIKSRLLSISSRLKNDENHRDSNLELFRIITMLLIIAHHYMVNSHYLDANGPIYQNPNCFRTVFLLLFGAWGKAGINCFVFISGWFMCKSKITVRKFLKLYLEVAFYSIAVPTVFSLFDKDTMSTTYVLRSLLPFKNIGNGFTQAYVAYYLFIPFVNALLQNLNKKQHGYLILLCLYMYIVLGTNVNYSITFNYVEWFIVLHIIAAYVRYYPAKIFESSLLWGMLLALAIIGTCVSVILCFKMSVSSGQYFTYRYVGDANYLFPFLTGISSFMLAKNIRIPYNRFINAVASTCFGVLQIHAANGVMREWLWVEILNNKNQFQTSHVYAHAILSVLGVFAACSLLDYLRIILLERPFFRLYDIAIADKIAPKPEETKA